MLHEEHLAIVVGRNRRVYARMYKETPRMQDYIRRFSEHYYETEQHKSYGEGYHPASMVLEKPNDTTWVFRISYHPILCALATWQAKGKAAEYEVV